MPTYEIKVLKAGLFPEESIPAGPEPGAAYHTACMRSENEPAHRYFLRTIQLWKDGERLCSFTTRVLPQTAGVEPREAHKNGYFHGQGSAVSPFVCSLPLGSPERKAWLEGYRAGNAVSVDVYSGPYPSE